MDFVFSPNWASAPSLKLSWLTNVITSRDDTEQRFQLRNGARASLTYEYLAGDTDEYRTFVNALLRAQAETLTVPLFTESAWLSAMVVAGSQNLALNTDASHYFSVGDSLLLTDGKTAEQVTVESLTGNALTLTTITSRTWPLGTRVAKALTARLSADQVIERLTDCVATAEITVDFLDEWTSTHTETDLYSGFSVLSQRPEFSSRLTQKVSRNIRVFDNSMGLRSFQDLSHKVRRTCAHRFVLSGITEIKAFFNFVMSRKGRSVPFWFPTQQPDFVIKQNIGATATQFLVENHGHAVSFKQPGRNHIEIKTTAGAVYRRKITAIEIVDSTRERITLSSALGVALNESAIEMASYLQLMRLSSDSVELTYQTDQHVICELNFYSLRDDQ